MEFIQASKSYYLDRSTYVIWVDSYGGQFITINSVKFLLEFDFHVISNIVIFLIF